MALLLCGAMLFAATACSGPAKSAARAAELLHLGEQYLADLDYEQALVQFLAVIELEPKNEQGYIGAADCYVGLEEYDGAVDILTTGYRRTKSFEIMDYLIWVLEEYLPARWEEVEEALGGSLWELLDEAEADGGWSAWADREDRFDDGLFADGDEMVLLHQDHVVDWVDEAFEGMIRAALGRPTGEILCSELHHITEMVIIGDSAFLVDLYSADSAPETFRWYYENRREDFRGSGGDQLAQDGAFFSFAGSVEQALRQPLDSPGGVALTGQPTVRTLESRGAEPKLVLLGGGVDRKEYGDYFVMGSVQSLDDIAHFMNLHRLSVRLNDVKILSGIAGLPRLRCLEIMDCTGGSFAFGGLDRLTHVSLDNNGLDSLDFLADSSRLYYLDCWEAGMGNVEALGGKQYLNTLELHLGRMADAEVLGGLSSLRYLGLYGGQGDYGALSRLSGLEFLRWESPALADLEFLEGMRSLTELSLGWGEVADLGGLRHFQPSRGEYSSLRVQDVGGLEDLSFLSGRSFRSVTLLPVATADIGPLLELPDGLSGWVQFDGSRDWQAEISRLEQTHPGLMVGAG